MIHIPRSLILGILITSCATTSDYWYLIRCQERGRVYFNELVRGDQMSLTDREYVVITYSKTQEVRLESRQCLMIRKGLIDAN